MNYCVIVNLLSVGGYSVSAIDSREFFVGTIDADVLAGLKKEVLAGKANTLRAVIHQIVKL